MKIVISTKSDVPIYIQVYEQISLQILSGDLPVNTPLPSIRQIASSLGISVITIKSAYELLEKEGFIVTYQGKGSFVAEKRGMGEEEKQRMITERLKTDVAYLRSLGITLDEIIKAIENMNLV